MFSGAKVFTIVDINKGYWQGELHPDSRKYTCMAFDIGRYQFKRVPMGMYSKKQPHPVCLIDKAGTTAVTTTFPPRI